MQNTRMDRQIVVQFNSTENLRDLAIHGKLMKDSVQTASLFKFLHLNISSEAEASFAFDFVLISSLKLKDMIPYVLLI